MNTPKKSILAGLPFYYGWVSVIIASLAMTATLPGRTFGLGLITEPLLADLNISRLEYGVMSFWATLLGALFNLVAGPLIDRWGSRVVLTLVAVGLGLTVLAMSGVATVAMLMICLILIRGFGQSALSVSSLTLIGKWFVRRLSIAMGIFSVAIGVMIGGAIAVLGSAVQQSGWRIAWENMGWLLLGFAIIAWTFTRRNPESIGLAADLEDDANTGKPDSQLQKQPGFSFGAALRTPALWVFVLGSSLYNLIIAGVTLHNESILVDLGFDRSILEMALISSFAVGLVGNIAAGYLAQRLPLGKIMAVSMLFLTAALLWFPAAAAVWQVMAVMMLLGASGGVVTVIFFTAFGNIFGRPHLGKIQGFAQVLTVLGSATGQWLVPFVFENYQGYSPFFFLMTPAVLIIAFWAFRVQIPTPEDGDLVA